MMGSSLPGWLTNWLARPQDGDLRWNVIADVLVDVHGHPKTHGIREHIDAMKAMVDAGGGTPAQITSHPIRFGSGEWTCVVGEFEGGGRMVTVAKWRDGAIAEEYIWM